MLYVLLIYLQEVGMGVGGGGGGGDGGGGGGGGGVSLVPLEIVTNILCSVLF